MQDMKSVYVDIKENITKRRDFDSAQKTDIDFSDVEFQIDLLKTDEINLDYILKLILEKYKEYDDIDALKLK